MAIRFVRATRKDSNWIIGLAGPNGSGKTLSAIRIGLGLAEGEPVYLIDTETGRGRLYADDYPYMYGELEPPFRPGAYLEAMKDAAKAGAKVIIVDSASHEHEGPGGLLEWQEEELVRLIRGDDNRREKMKFTSWIKPKAEHNKFVNEFLRLDCHLIFCFRAKDKLEMKKVRQPGGKYKTEVVPAGWQPICAERMEYEMGMILMLPKNSRGIPDLGAEATRINYMHRGLLKAGDQLDEEFGRKLAAWARGTGKEPQKTPFEEARLAAEGGKKAFQEWWNGPGKDKDRTGTAKRDHARPRMDELQAIVMRVENPEGEPVDEDPFALEVETADVVSSAPAPEVVAAPEPEQVDPYVPVEFDKSGVPAWVSWLSAARKVACVVDPDAFREANETAMRKAPETVRYEIEAALARDKPGADEESAA